MKTRNQKQMKDGKIDHIHGDINPNFLVDIYDATGPGCVTFPSVVFAQSPAKDMLVKHSKTAQLNSPDNAPDQEKIMDSGWRKEINYCRKS